MSSGASFSRCFMQVKSRKFSIFPASSLYWPGLHYCGLAMVISALITGKALAADWPQWGGSSRRNMASVEKRLPAGFDPGKKQRDRLGWDTTTAKNVRWVVRLGSQNYSSPVI